MVSVAMENDCQTVFTDGELIRKIAGICLEIEEINAPCQISVLLTDGPRIREINREWRSTDRETDVLSFPSLPFSPRFLARDHQGELKEAFDIDTGCCFLGDIVISVPRAAAQAKEYGHSFRREIAYLTAHAMFHLLGYDHMEDQDKTLMRKKEDKVMQIARIPRITDTELAAKAAEAMLHSYSPYSHYAVGACLLCDDGSIYTGCNVENASYGASMCAERTAVFKAVSEGHRVFTAIAIAAHGSMPWPCGICRQVLYEFSPDMRVIVTSDGEIQEALLSDLLVHGFGPADLRASDNGTKGGNKI